MSINLRLLLFTVFAVFFFQANALAEFKIPERPANFVMDNAGVLHSHQKHLIYQALLRHYKTTGNQVAVAIFRSLEGESLEELTKRIAEQWKIGAILFAFMDEREVRIEVSPDLETKLTDVVTQSILQRRVTPHFHRHKYSDGITSGVKSILNVLNYSTLDAPKKITPPSNQTTPSPPSSPSQVVWLIPIVILLLFLIGFFWRWWSGRASPST